MTDLVFDIYPPPTSAGTPGTRLRRLTREDYGLGTFYHHVRSGVGAGQVVVERGQSFVTATNFAVNNYVIVRDLDRSTTDTLNVLGGFSLQKGDFQVVADPGEGVLKFGGPSTLGLLHDAILGPEALSTFAGPQDIIDGYWRWGTDVYGGVMRRAIVEANLQDPPGLPMIAITESGGVLVGSGVQWTDADDSNGDPWPAFAGEYRTQAGTTLLELYQELFGYGVELEMDARTFQVYGYNPDGYGDDLSGGAFGSGVVRFEAEVNIAKGMDRHTQGRLPLTHVLVRTTDMPQGSWIESDSYSPGDPVRKGPYQTGDISGDPALSTVIQDRVQRLIDIRGLAEDGISFYSSMPGDDEANGRYSPGPHYSPGPNSGTAGHYWTGDLVTIHSGTDSVDYNEATKRIETLTFELTEAADDDDHGWNVLIGVGPRIGPGSTSLTPALSAIPLPFHFCEPSTPSSFELKLYPSNSVSPLTYSDAGGWDSAGASHRQWKTTLDASYLGTGSGNTTSQGGDADGRNIQLFSGTYGPLSSAEAALFAAGGLVFQGQSRTRMRSGIGISEASQDGISQELVRILQSDGSVRGVALDLHGLTSSAGSTKWRANTIHQNRAFPPAAESGVLDPVAGCVAGDYVQIDEGMRNYTLVTSGGALLLANDEDTDLPVDEVSTSDLNTWITFSASGIDPDSGCRILDTVIQGAASFGECNGAPRCDHQHEHGLLSFLGTNYHQLTHIDGYIVFNAGAPTATDDEDDGYHLGTIWVDSTSADPDDPDVYMATKVLAGAAVWKTLGGGGGGSGAPTTADYLVGTAQAGLSGEIVVGTTPGGELGGTWAAPTVDAVHSGSSHASITTSFTTIAKWGTD